MHLPFPMGLIIKPMMLAIELLGLCIKHMVLADSSAGQHGGRALGAGGDHGPGLRGQRRRSVSRTRPTGNGGLTATISVVASTLFSCLELFVAFLQAYVFTFLSALFIGAAIHHH